MTRDKATAIGFGAVLLWALLAVLTVASAPVPPLLLNALCFAVGGLAGLIWTVASGQAAALRQVPLRVYAFGTLGLFGYHALYFSALRLAPAAEAGLIAYLWPLLIVIFSGLLPGERLRPGHLLGAAMGFAGAALIILRGGSEGFSSEHAAGFALAGLCALTWSGYSVLSRRLGAAPTSSVAVFCLASALLSGVLHLAFETMVWPDGPTGWLATLGLGLGPVGLAFYLWDIGVKRGDIQLLGTSSYAAPLLSTLVLVATGIARPTWVLAAAAVLITGGAVVAARASLAARRQFERRSISSLSFSFCFLRVTSSSPSTPGDRCASSTSTLRMWCFFLSSARCELRLMAILLLQMSDNQFSRFRAVCHAALAAFRHSTAKL